LLIVQGLTGSVIGAILKGSKRIEPMTTWNCELTDTFGGEANYSWVRRADITVPDNASRLAIIRAAKSALGLTNVRCNVSDFGDMYEIRPTGSNTVAFVS